MTFSGHAYLALNDDPYLWDFLVHGENRTLIMSYPLSTLAVRLYEIFPDIQWFSWIMVGGGVILNYFFAVYITSLGAKSVRWLMAAILTLADLFLWYHFSITLLTMFLAVFSFVFLPRREAMFWGGLVTATLLRDEIVFGVMPLFLTAYLFLSDRTGWNPGRIATVVLALGTLAAIHYSPRLDTEYSKWLTYHEARVYFTDLGGKDLKGVLRGDEKTFVRSWYNQDEELISSEKVVKAAGSHLDVVLTRLSHPVLRRIAGRIYHHKMILVLLFCTGLLVYWRAMGKVDTALLLVFVTGFFILIYVRDAPRVTFPLLFLWLIMLMRHMESRLKEKHLKLILGAVFVTLLIDLPLHGEHRKEDLMLRDEAVQLMKKHPEYIRYEPAITFPRAYNGYIGTAMTQNRLFDEKEWIANYILPAGWISRHPYFYASHHISTKNKKRKFKNYYEFLTDRNTAFIGSKEINDEFNTEILKMMDRLHPKGRNCRHVVKIIDESEHFSIVRVLPECGKE
ncbi:hypothetical protein [Hydrogenimonas sp. SS33]|uniref:hypothetical protein n=1 Tax=Hydrogenimonas leucolamina TaxID=2954236 RepID=UPI00336BCFEB